jgi:hypothetical protein
MLATALFTGLAALKAQQTIPLLDATVTMWRYFQNQSVCLDGSNWEKTGYNDAAWTTGPGLLAFENNPAIAPLIHTTLQSPSLLNGAPVYFRTYFNWTNPTAKVTLLFSNYVDDCSAIFLNGTLLTNAGVNTPITCTSFGRTAISGDAVAPEVFRIPGTLVQGVNLIAAEVHQMNAASGDVVWGCSLSVVKPRMTVQVSGTRVTICWTADKDITYRVQYRSDLAAGVWSTVRDCVSSAEAMACEDFESATKGFYRVVVAGCQ